MSGVRSLMPTKDISYYQQLLIRYVQRDLARNEAVELLQWMSASPDGYNQIMNAAELKELMQNRFIQDNNNHRLNDNANQASADALLQRIYRTINDASINRDTAEALSDKNQKELHKPRVRSIMYWKYAAAIAAIIIGIGVYYFLHPDKPNQIAQTLQIPSKEILPGSNKAVLTLSNGQKIELNNATSETITDGSLSIKNTGGHLSYGDPANPLRGGVAPGAENSNINPSGPGVGVAPNNATNTMTTPRGGQYQLTLSDGTKVWLNAASSITYPVTFSSKTREVKISGEAYFEVAQNKEKPFIVKGDFEKVGHDNAPNETLRGGFSITVLGTSFNVNTYPDEPYSKTSLISGSIKIQPTFVLRSSKRSEGDKASAGEAILKPSQAYSNGKIIPANIEKDLAWKNGYFNFDSADLQTVMRQLSRWYDLTIVYEKQPKIQFVGEMTRNISLQSVLKILEGAGVKFRIENRTLTVQ